MTVLEWCLYLLIKFNTGSFVFWKPFLHLWLAGIFKLGTIFTNNLLYISTTSLSSEIISSDYLVDLSLYWFSVKIIFDLLLTLCVNKGFTVFQKVLLSVTCVLRLLKIVSWLV